MRGNRSSRHIGWFLSVGSKIHPGLKTSVVYSLQILPCGHSQELAESEMLVNAIYHVHHLLLYCNHFVFTLRFLLAFPIPRYSLLQHSRFK